MNTIAETLQMLERVFNNRAFVADANNRPERAAAFRDAVQICQMLRSAKEFQNTDIQSIIDKINND